ncbi:CWC16 protein [Coniella lustricola]|uniref:CWC16 protein n=1 Tax=Coniella lustricola TaxID=2025994 RepID=A0A2T3AI90_9PEZI|nr:CWC16 protein [Coniella lustricola]
MQGFNMGRYVPPEHEGVLSANQASRHAKPHALGARARKLKTEGILTVRFEMPFAVWCGHCQPQHSQLIGQGVRFNAEKRKIGNYYSSPVFAFRMRHVVCGGWIEIQTDPKNTAYVVVSGGQRRTEASADGDAAGDGQATNDSLVNLGAGPLVTPAERDAQRASAFANLEKTIQDRAALERATERIEEMEEASSRHWDDPYARNQALRRSFRVGRKARERTAAADEALQKRLGLGIDLLPESEEDVRRARLVEFGTRPEDERERSQGRDEGRVLAKPLFGDDSKSRAPSVEKSTSSTRASSGKSAKRLKSQVAASKVKQSLVSEIFDNTRLASDPFLEPRGKDVSRSASAPLIPGLKRKRGLVEPPSPAPAVQPAEKAVAVSSILVDYDSE